MNGLSGSRVPSRPPPPLTGSVSPGKFSWATVHQFDEREGKAKCVAQHDLDIYTGAQGDGIKRWNVSTGG